MRWHEETEKPGLTDMEDVVLWLREELGQEMVEVLVSMEEGNRPVPGPTCPRCGREMRYKDQKTDRVESRVGELRQSGDTTTARDARSDVPPWISNWR